jgi:hypothetical protein
MSDDGSTALSSEEMVERGDDPTGKRNGDDDADESEEEEDVPQQQQQQEEPDESDSDGEYSRPRGLLTSLQDAIDWPHESGLPSSCSGSADDEVEVKRPDCRATRCGLQGS